MDNCNLEYKVDFFKCVVLKCLFLCYSYEVVNMKYNNGVISMSKVCEICGKRPTAGHNVSHSHRVTNRWFKPNIQRITIKDTKGTVRKANICTKCMKSDKIERA